MITGIVNTLNRSSCNLDFKGFIALFVILHKGGLLNGVITYEIYSATYDLFI